ncbi:MAG: putative NADH-quinone oxidoreductase subunit L [Chloroflexi bacterium OLB13]|nr:MAG: putative NADH-quinone oxidoreductase subunit L [Chloroflexi bacterium OLB13]
MSADFLYDPNFLPWLIPVGPLLGFLIIVLATNRSRWVPATNRHEYGGHHPAYDGMSVPVVAPASRVLSVIVGLGGVTFAFVISLLVVLRVSQVDFVFGEHVFGSTAEWMSTGITNFNMGVMVDPLTTIMLIMVPLAVVCIFIYSIGYMAHDPRQARFFAMISLFAGAMLTLVVANNLLLLFIGWEIMGLCSYLLIGFWFEKEVAYKAAVKAFMTTRVADVIMLLGIAYLYSITGTLNFRDILYNTEVLETLANTPAILIGGMSASGLIGIFLITGTIGKSAQFPLHVWLPDAMEGPTPVSAMIHAAAMVSAGVYAILRMYPLLEAGSHPHAGEFNSPLLLMAIVGGFTALFSATIAVAQNDVKKVLAFSTISQLGFMMAALGIGAYIAAAFHLITHAFFKALLFMASGSVIHAMEHGEHHTHEHAHGEHDDEDEDDHAHDHAAEAHHDGHAEHHEEHHDEAHSAPHFDPQDMLNMGGLNKRIPVTFYTFVIGGLSLAGFPLLTAGFWSKDEILADAWLGTTEGFGPHAFVFLMLAIAAFLTAFYTARQLCLTFLGEPRSEAAKHAGLGGPTNIVSITMQLPLIILAVFAIVAGFVGVPPDFPIFGAIFSPEHNNFKHFVNEALPPAIQAGAPAFNWFPVGISFLVALGGLGLGYLMYGRKPLKAGEADPLVKMLGPMHNVLKNRYYFDELYEIIFVKPAQATARVVSEFVDRGIIDGTLHTIAFVFRWTGDLLKMLNLWLIDGFGDGVPRLIGWTGLQIRRIQTGRVQQYLLLVAAAAVIIGLAFVVSAGAAAN